MKCSLALVGCFLVQALVIAQDSTQRDTHVRAKNVVTFLPHQYFLVFKLK